MRQAPPEPNILNCSRNRAAPPAPDVPNHSGRGVPAFMASGPVAPVAPAAPEKSYAWKAPVVFTSFGFIAATLLDAAIRAVS